jgi:predicted metal-dependent hydrolase
MVVEGIELEVVRKRIKHLYLRVRSPDGRVVVSAPLKAGDALIEDFVASRIGWIRHHQERIELSARREAAKGPEGEVLRVWGSDYPLTRVEGPAFGLSLRDGQACLVVRPGSSTEERAAYVRAWYRRELCREVERLLPVWERRMGLECAEWRTRYMKTRWGSCNPTARRIWLNIQLAEHPVACLEYVIVHELAHLRERSHGPRFQAIMDEYLPSWRLVRAQLNEA